MQWFSSCIGLLAELPPAGLMAELFNSSAWSGIWTLKDFAVMEHCMVLCNAPTFCPEADNRARQRRE